MKFLTGCSGWQYPEWKNIFYPKKLPASNWLEFYAKIFNTVEVNSTFYRFPVDKNLLQWYELTPKNFKFSLKAHRLITHYHQFHHTNDLIKDFYKKSDALKNKMGCILFQLPKLAQYDMAYLYKIVAQLSADKCNVLEFQHVSWWRQDVLEFLNKKNIIFANINSPIIQQPLQNTGDKYYLRFHGMHKWYQGIYNEEFLQQRINTIKKNHAQEVWCYFNNTMDLSAINDAKLWQKLI